MRMIPSVPLSPSQSRAEQKVFKAFETTRLSSSSVCLHSLRLAKHEYKREGELDFVLVSPQGLFVFEVKGGGVARDANGIWFFTDRFGDAHRKSEGPFEQARSGMYSLRARLIERFGETEIQQFHYGYGVIFPECSFDIATVEWPREIVLDEREFESLHGFERYIARVIQYWQSKSSRGGGAPIPLVEQVVSFMRPVFDRIPNLHQRATRIDEELESLTSEQYSRLDIAEDNARILCSGGAGTGKTFLAAELARRHSARGQSVLFLCRSPQLANHLRTQIPSMLVTIATILQLPAIADAEARKCEVLIVDEAQDMMSMGNLDMMDKVVAGGLADGTWRFFYDANNQITDAASYDPDAMGYLKTYVPALINLKRNCRNTHTIVVQTKLLTAADLGSPSAGEGPPVRYRYYQTPKEAADILSAELSRLLADDVMAKDVTILSRRSYEESSVRLLPSHLRSQIRNLALEPQPMLSVNCFSFCDIDGYKGLENQFIIVTDIEWESLDHQWIRYQLYVAMSRARTELTLIMHNDTMEHLAPIMMENNKRLGEDTHAR